MDVRRDLHCGVKLTHTSLVLATRDFPEHCVKRPSLVKLLISFTVCKYQQKQASSVNKNDRDLSSFGHERLFSRTASLEIVDQYLQSYRD